MENNILLYKLKRRHNVIFLQYKLPINYLRVPSILPVNFAGIIILKIIIKWIKIFRI